MFEPALNHVRIGCRVMLVAGVASVAVLATASQAAFAQGIIRIDPLFPGVPEIDALAGASALALLVGAIALIRERRKRRRDKSSD